MYSPYILKCPDKGLLLLRQHPGKNPTAVNYFQKEFGVMLLQQVETFSFKREDVLSRILQKIVCLFRILTNWSTSICYGVIYFYLILILKPELGQARRFRCPDILLSGAGLHEWLNSQAQPRRRGSSGSLARDLTSLPRSRPSTDYLLKKKSFIINFVHIMCITQMKALEINELIVKGICRSLKTF